MYKNEKNGTYWNIQSMYVRGGKKMTRQEIPVFKTREENVAYMNATLPIRESFDLIQRDLLIGGRVFFFLLCKWFYK